MPTASVPDGAADSVMSATPTISTEELRRIIDGAVNDAYALGFKACITTIAEAHDRFPGMTLDALLAWALELLQEFEAGQAKRATP